MRLIRCHVENFGKLRDYTVDFEKGCNIFQEPNGWGKSTLAVFLRVMFFGFGGENKRKEAENERKRFQPWQGGVYGGQIIFETDGKRYLAARIFGNKKQNDVFELRDADTNLESRDFTENLGEEIFQINSESFQRTIFIGQNDCVTHSTDNINARIGNLADNMEDLDCYEKAAGLLQEQMNRLNPRRKTGEIYQINDRITRMQTEIAAGAVLENTMEQADAAIRRETGLLDRKTEERKSLDILREKVSRTKDLEGKRMVYRQLCEDCAEKEALVKKKEEAFPGEIPREEEIRECMEACDRMEQAGRGMEISRLTGEELRCLENWRTIFDEDPDGSAGGACEEGDRNMEQLRKEAGEVSELIRMMTEAGNREKVRSIKQAALETMKAARREDRGEEKKHPVLLIAGAVLAVLGGILCTGYVLPGAGLIVAGVILAAAGIVEQRPGRSGETTEKDDSSLQAVRDMEEELRQDELFIRETERQAAEYLDRRGENIPAAAVADRLREILEELIGKEKEMSGFRRQYSELKARQEKYQDFCKQYTSEQQEILGKLRGMGFIPMDHSRMQLQGIWQDYTDWKYSFHSLEEARRKKQKFETENDMDRISAAAVGTDMPTLEELNRQAGILDETIEQIRGQLRGYEDQMESLREKYDAWTEEKNLLEKEKEKLAGKNADYRHICMAREYLARAKGNLTARYMEPLMDGFSRYYNMILDAGAERFSIDADINIMAKEQGMQRELQYLSTGWQDLAGFCMRLALADAMYQGEKPFLILDDPFVNLDDEKKEGGLRLLEKAAEEYQIIYFTCSESRS